MFMRCTGSAQGSKPTNGRWSNHEHTMFLEALNLFGREWKKVADFIQTRSSAQIRSHAQKYFAKLEKEEEKGIHGGAAAIHGEHVVLIDASPGCSKRKKKRKRRRQQQPSGGITAKKFKEYNSSCTIGDGTNDLLSLRSVRTESSETTYAEHRHQYDHRQHFRVVSTRDEDRSVSPTLLLRGDLSRNDSPRTARVRVQGVTPVLDGKEVFPLSTGGAPVGAADAHSSIYEPQLDADMSHMSALLQRREALAKSNNTKFTESNLRSALIYSAASIDQDIEVLYNTICQVSRRRSSGEKENKQCACRRLCHVVHCRGDGNGHGPGSGSSSSSGSSSMVESMAPATTLSAGVQPNTTTRNQNQKGCITTRRNVLFLVQSSFKAYPIFSSFLFEQKMLNIWNSLNSLLQTIEMNDSSISMYETAQIFASMSKESQTRLQDLNETELTAIQVLVGTKMGLKPKKSPLRVSSTSSTIVSVVSEISPEKIARLPNPSPTPQTEHQCRYSREASPVSENE